MPSTYAHRCFGADVLTQLPEALQKKIEPYRALYDIGLHGPDLLFYYKALQSNPVNRLGMRCTSSRAPSFLNGRAA